MHDGLLKMAIRARKTAEEFLEYQSMQEIVKDLLAALDCEQKAEVTPTDAAMQRDTATGAAAMARDAAAGVSQLGHQALMSKPSAMTGDPRPEPQGQRPKRSNCRQTKSQAARLQIARRHCRSGARPPLPRQLTLHKPGWPTTKKRATPLTPSPPFPFPPVSPPLSCA